MLLTLPVLTLELGPGSNEGIPRDLEAVQGFDILSEALGAGATAPAAIVVDTGSAGGAGDPAVAAALTELDAGSRPIRRWQRSSSTRRHSTSIRVRATSTSK